MTDIVERLQITDAMLRAACDAERRHDNASPCHFCPERCGNDALAAAIRVALGEVVAEIEWLRAALLKIATMRPSIPEDEEGHAPNWDQYVFTRTWAAFAAELQRIANTALGEARRD